MKYQFQKAYPDENVIPNSSIQHLVKKFEEMGMVCDLPGGGQRTTQTEEMKDVVKKRLEATTTISSGRLAMQLPTSHTTTYRMMWQRAYPYKIQVVHELKPADPGKCIAFCNWLLRYVSRSHSVSDTGFLLDEAWFHLSGYVNAQNYRVWSSINSHQYIETTLHPQKLGVWCAISRKRLVGPIFFQHHHFRSLSRLITRFIALLEISECDVVFQQNNARLHVSASTMDFLRSFLANTSFPPVCGPHKVPN